jgi:hypothetical protein
MSDRRSDAQRQRDHELGVKHRLVWSGCELPLDGLEWMLDHGFLAAELSEDKHAVKAAVSELLWRLFHPKNRPILDRLVEPEEYSYRKQPRLCAAQK